MKNTLKLTLLSVVFIASNIQASAPTSLPVQQEAQFDPRTFRGRIIDATTIKDLAPQAPALIKAHATQWLTNNPDFAQTALSYQRLLGQTEAEKNADLPSVTRRADDAAQALILAKTGCPNMSQCNYVFRLPTNQALVLKVAGVINLKEGMNRLAAHIKAQNANELDQELNPSKYYKWGKQLEPQDYERFEQNLHDNQCDTEIIDGKAIVRKDAPKTYQTISRMAYHLRLKEVIEQNQLPLALPAMHLVHIPGRPQEISDRNYVVIEERVEGLQDVAQITAQEDTAIKKAIQYAGLFELNAGGLKRTAEGKLVLLDLEQPNNSNPLKFFHEDQKAYKGNYEEGLRKYANNFGNRIVTANNAQKTATETK